MNAFLTRITVLLVVVCSLAVSPAVAQYIPEASKQGISYQEMREHLEKLYAAKDDAAVQQQLKDEADALANHTNEALISLAILTYEQLLGFYKRERNTISSIYADALLHTGNYQKASELALKLLSDTEYNNDTTPKDVNTLATSYVARGRKKDALSVYETFIRKHGSEAVVAQQVKSLYLELHPSEDFDAYMLTMEEQARAERLAKYAKEMIRKEAPAFTLFDRDGKTVSRPL